MRNPDVVARVAFLLCVLAIAPLALAANVIEIENARPGDPGWNIYPEANGEIEGYASPISVTRGESVNIYVNTVESTYTLEVYRMGWYGGAGARRMLGPIGRTGVQQTIPAPDSTGRVECNWTDPYILGIPNSADPTDWPSGIYIVRLTAGTSGKQKYTIFVVRDDVRHAAHYFQSSVTTSQAYNNWGGKSLYSFNSCGASWRSGCAGSGFVAAVRVSFDRPMEANGGAGDFLWGWEYNMVRFLEREGYDVSYSTNIDTARRGSLLLNHRDFLSVGHDEYWSWEMRQNVEAARNAGVNLGFFSANTAYWQIRLEPNSRNQPDRTMVSYKEKATSSDPYAIDSDPNNNHLVTTKWRDAPVSRPESALLGVQYFYDESNMAADMVIDNVTAAPWVFAGTGATTGTRLPGLVGYEVDGMTSSSPAGTIRLANSPFLNKKVNPQTTQFSHMVLHTAQSGATVFATGTIQWSWGLDDYNMANRPPNAVVSPIAQQITRNILDRFAGEAHCAFTISPSSASVTGAPGSGSITVTGGATCDWHVTNSASWVTITSSTGTGGGTLNYSWTQNSGGARTATIAIGDKTFTLTQAACSYALSKTSQGFTPAGGTDSITMTAPTGCSWTASVNQSWVTITSATSGNGNGTIAYSVQANSGPARSATLTIGGVAVSIQQSAGCTYSATPGTINAATAGSPGVSVNLTTSNPACTWSIAESATWINVTSPLAGSGSSTITLDIAPNTGIARSATLTIGGATVNVQQPNGCTYSVAPTAATFSSAANSGSVTLSASAGECPWTATSSASWLTFTPGSTTTTTGTGTKTVSYAVSQNSGAPRDATITAAGQTVAVHQGSGCGFTVTPTTASYSASSNSGSIALTATSSSCSWTATTSVPWLVITSADDGRGTSTVNYSVSSNPGAARTGTITAGATTITINQASGCVYTISPEYLEFGSGAGSGSVTINATASDCPWTIANTTNYIAFATSSGNGTTTVSFNITANPGPRRSVSIPVADEVLTIEQINGCTFSVTPTSASFSADATRSSVTVTASAAACTWSASSSTSWIDLAATSGTGSGTLPFDIGANTGAARSSTFRVAGQTVSIQQSSSSCSYSASPTSFSFDANGGGGSVAVSANCSWTSSSSAPWITITAGANGAANGATTFTVAPNSGAARSTQFSVAGNTITVNQSAPAPSCTAPLITQHPQGKTIAPGGSATLTVTASGTPLNYQWHIGTPGVTTNPIVGASSASLTVSPSSSTQYWVRVFNSCGSAQSASSAIAVGVPQRAKSDFDGDGRSDIFWRNPSNGSNGLWFMNGFASAGHSLLTADPMFSQIAAGDFNGDGFADLLWRDPSAGQNYIWLMRGTSIQSITLINATDPAYALAAVADFNGDGKADILWRHKATGSNSMWLMNGTTVMAGETITQANISLVLAGVGDFNGDGKADLLWRDPTNGFNSMWLMNGMNTLAGETITQANHTLTLAGVGDFNGDGRDDILWTNRPSAFNSMWMMDGFRVIGGETITPSDPSLTTVRIGEFNGDGKADILWRNDATGFNAIWMMNGLFVASGSTIASADPGFRPYTP
jgi:hypothetical protein